MKFTSLSKKRQLELLGKGKTHYKEFLCILGTVPMRYQDVAEDLEITLPVLFNSIRKANSDGFRFIETHYTFCFTSGSLNKVKDLMKSMPKTGEKAK